MHFGQALCQLQLELFPARLFRLPLILQQQPECFFSAELSDPGGILDAQALQDFCPI